MLDRIYTDFTQRVSDGRELPLDEVLEVARGRIWTGEDALRIGLVDELGGLDVALRLAREAAGLEPDADVRLRRFPARRSTWTMLLERAEGADRSTLRATTQLLRSVQPFAQALGRTGLFGDPGVLTMPETISGF
jgi:protease-4